MASDGESLLPRWNCDQYGRATNKLDAASIVNFVYAYGAKDRITNRVDALNRQTWFEYDPVGNFTPSLSRLWHLDSISLSHHDAAVRTTVTLDKDVERMLREAMHHSRSGFKQTLNSAIRAGLGKNAAIATCKPFVIKARPLGLRAGLDPGGLNKLVDDLEVEAVLEKSRSVERK